MLRNKFQIKKKYIYIQMFKPLNIELYTEYINEKIRKRRKKS